MASLNLNDPNHPTFRYESGGATIEGGVQCSCRPADTACLADCQTTAQALLDADLVAFPEDP